MKCLLTFLSVLSLLTIPVRSDELEQNFPAPPDAAKPDVWWHWMDGSVTKAGITADLEAMKRVGIGSAQIFNLQATPAGPVKFLSPEWHEMMKHSGKEAERLGLKLSIHNCAGWSSSGGPWNTPENSMQRVTIDETRMEGPAHISTILPQPETKLGFYRDIAVLAIPTPGGEGVDMKSFSPKVTASVPDIDAEVLFDGKSGTYVSLSAPKADAPQFIQLEFAKPFAARSLELALGPAFMDVRGVVQVSGDGKEFKDLKPFVFPRPGTNGRLVLSFGAEAVPARFYRIKFTVGGLLTDRLTVAGIALSPALRVGDIEGKSGMNSGSLMPDQDSPSARAAESLVVKRDRILDLSSHLKTDGSFEWDAPPGRWTILRIGYTPVGKDNHPAAEGGVGLECDKLSSEALDAHWKGYVQKVLDDLGPLVGKDRTFNNVLIDSYEIGGQNWTAKFREEFQHRRGYDPVPYLVTFTGRVVDTPEISERFLRDMRRTISDLFAEKYYGHFKQLCNERGLTASIEPYTGPFESLQVAAAADIPMGEFWIGNFYDSLSTTKLAASAGHIYDRRIIGAESFTAAPSERHGRWLDDPYALKAVGDLVYCHGVNRFTLHRYAMQPWTDRLPGMTMGHWGTHFDRTVTWFEQGRAWMEYLARCQFLLQQGRFVADAAYFYGEDAPVESLENNPSLPPGYDFDGINADVLLHKASMKDGRLVLDSGMSYSVLVLPPSVHTMTPALLAKLREFVAGGLTLVGPPPLRAPGLSGWPDSDRQVREMASEIWGNCDGEKITEYPYGKGKAVWGQPMRRVLDSLSLKPDFEFQSGDRTQLNFIHRQTDGADIYFISNQRDRFDVLECTFRVGGKVPEIWYPDTGRMVTAGIWHEENGRTSLPLAFDPSGSLFVVFRKPSGTADHIVSASCSGSPEAAAQPPRLKILQAMYEALDGSGSLDVTEKLTEMVRGDSLRVEASNTALGEDPARFRPKQLRVRYELDGKTGEQTARVEEFLEIGKPFGAGTPAGFRFHADTEGRTVLLASKPGDLKIQTASGQTREVHVRDIPAPLEVGGPWELKFPPNWGAPAKVLLPRLISWSDHEEAGVRYFSGTATYVKDVDIPSEMLGPGHLLWLDLGQVKNLAEVFLNGKPQGILWKPPFRVDITDAAKPGANKLEIHVTNLWPNRLIGDEQLPPDCEWGDKGQLKSWPQWLLDGKKSPSGRFTFTTWRHWKRDDALLPSGLLGPVTLQSEAVLPVSL